MDEIAASENPGNYFPLLTRGLRTWRIQISVTRHVQQSTLHVKDKEGYSIKQQSVAQRADKGTDQSTARVDASKTSSTPAEPVRLGDIAL